MGCKFYIANIFWTELAEHRLEKNQRKGFASLFVFMHVLFSWKSLRIPSLKMQIYFFLRYDGLKNFIET